MKGLKKTLIIAFIAELFTLGFLVWFGNTTGTPGLLNWMPFYNSIFKALELLLLIPLIFFLICLLTNIFNSKKQRAVKATKIISIVFSLLTLVISISLTIGIIYIGNYIPKNRSVLENMLPRDNLPELKHIAVDSDPHWYSPNNNAEERNKILRNISARNYDAFLCLGDLSEQGSCFFDYNAIVDELNETISNTPFRAMMGNHDSLVNAKRIFQTYFNNDPNAPLYYRMDSGKVHIIVLNLLWSAEDFTPTQERWLIEQLKSIPQEETVVVLSHCYFVGSGYVDKETNCNWFDIPVMIEKLCPIFEKYNVDLVLSGHNHFLELLKKENVTYGIVGAMGGKLDSEWDYNSPYSLWSNNQVFGWLDLTFNENSIDLLFNDSDGKELYRYTVKTN